jgi:Lon protease-like protein
MARVLLPIFPLPAVVFPRTPMPLHIFEDRYKEMIGEALENGTEFGIVQATEDGVLNAGCSVRVSEVLKRYDDGRLDILVVGVRRFEVLHLDTQRSFLRAEVEFYDDEDAAPAPREARLRALEEYRRLNELGLPRPYGEAQLSDPQLSFQLAFGLPDLNFLQVLLHDRSESSRLQQVTEYLARYIPRLRETERMKRLAPLNGHGQRAPEL